MASTNVFFTYVQELSALNLTHVQPGQMPTLTVFNALAWGLVEEREEFLRATSEERELLELGDCLAYTTLLLLCVASVEDVAELLERGTEFKYDELKFFANLKRINREMEKFDWAQALACWSSLFLALPEFKFHRFSFAEIAEANIQKLKDRYNRDVLFKGSGDKR